MKYVEQGQQKMRNIFQAVKVIHDFLDHLNISKRTGISDLSIHALSGELHDSQIVEDVLATTKTLDSEGLKGLLAIIPDSLAGTPQFH